MTSSILPLLVSLAFGEGTDQLGTAQRLQAATVLGVDIVDSASERVTWTGTGTVQVFDPSGNPVATLASGDSYQPTSSGVHELVVDQAQSGAWDVAVQGATGGRLFSTDWRFNAGSFAESAATDGSFYALVPAGSDAATGVIELKLAGLAGYVYTLKANNTGVDGSRGLSVPQSGNQVFADYPIYLQPPEVSGYNPLKPGVPTLGFEGALSSTDVYGDPLTCDGFLAGRPATFAVDTDVEGTAHIRCDLNNDGRFDTTGTDDLLLIAAVSPGTNSIVWDGTDKVGNPVSPGDYQCEVSIHTGEFHYVGEDIETSYPGLRLYQVQSSGDRAPLDMYWDDARVQSNALVMDNGEVGLERSPPSGVSSGEYGSPTLANINARSWGAWQGAGKGNQAFLDTFTWLESTTSQLLTLRGYDQVDSDGDGLSDYDEACSSGTDPDDPDTDGDGVEDGVQHGDSTSSQVSGLESNGRLAQAIAEQTLLRRFYPTSPSGLRSDSYLRDWLPDVGPAGAVAVDASPEDLVLVTNASSTVGIDFVGPGGNRQGGILLIETTGEHYEHSKLLCDRAAGASLPAVRDMDGQLAVAELVHPDGHRDHAIQWVRVQTGEDTWELMSPWLVDELPTLASSDMRAVQVQVWGNTPGFATEVAQALAARWGHDVPQASPPANWLRQAVTQAGQLDVDTVAPLGPEQDVYIHYWDEQGMDHRALLGEELPVFTNAFVELEDDERVVDRAWVSDGTWLSLSDQPFGGASTTAPMEVSCVDRGLGDAWLQERGIPSVSFTPIAGCEGSMLTVAEGGWAGVARHLSRPTDVKQSWFFYLQSQHQSKACAESLTTGSHACATLPAMPEGGWVLVPTHDFEGDVSALQSADLLTFVSDTHGQQPLFVAGFSTGPYQVEEQEPVSDVGCGCSSVTSSSWGGLFGLFVAGLVARRRR